jgi:hypothetical protein
MKKLRLAAFLLVLLLVSPLHGFAQNASGDDDVEQVLIPKEVFVGDRAQIKYTFRSAVDFFALADKSRIENDTLTLLVSQKPFTDVADKCTVQSAVLIRNNLSYSLVITFVPWQPGRVDFAPFDLNVVASAVPGKESSTDEAHFIIDLAPVTIASLVERTGATALKPPVPPIVVPGTNYLIWSFAIIILILIFVAGIIIAKLPQLIEKIQTWKEQYGFYRNANSTCKKLHKLSERKNIDDRTFAACWQVIVRAYLERRFATSFASVPSSRIEAYIWQLTGETISPEQQDTVHELNTLFSRTDYIRFAAGSVDSELLPLQEHQAVFAEHERVELVERTEQIVKYLEVKKEEEDGPQK